MAGKRGGARRGAGRKRADDGDHYSFLRLTTGGQEAYKRLEREPDWRALGPWGIISRGLEIAEQLRAFDDPSEHIDPYRARQHKPRTVGEMMRRYQRMCGVGMDQARMATLIGVNKTTYGNYVNGGRSSVPRAVAHRAREIARDFGLGRDPNLDKNGHDIGWQGIGLREGLGSGRSSFVVGLDEWAASVPMLEIELRRLYPNGVGLADIKGPTWIAWKLLPVAERGLVAHMTGDPETCETSRLVDAKGPAEAAAIEAERLTKIDGSDFIRRQEAMVAAASAKSAKTP